MRAKFMQRIRQTALFLVALTGLQTAMADLPSVKLQTAPLVTPQAAVTYYNTLPMSHSTGIVATALPGRPPEIQELARALGATRYSATAYAATVYEYIRNNIAAEFRFGLSKGARGALIDQSGTPFDQVHLMVELLRQGGLSATYNVGVLSLTGAQFTAWSGISDALSACQYLADGGVPATVNGQTSCGSLTAGTSLSSVTMLHIWVTANGTIYDPSYKVQIKKAGMDLATALGCPGGGSPCASSLLSTSLVPAVTTNNCGISGVSCVVNVNRAGIENLLQAYATNLQHFVQNYNTTNNTYASLEDVIGGVVIDMSQSTASGSLLPVSAYGTASYTWTDIPDSFRTMMTVTFDQIIQQLFADETAGNRLKLWGYADSSFTNATTEHFTLYAEYAALAHSDQANVSNVPTNLSVAIHHPYVANSGQYASETATIQLLAVTDSCGGLNSSCGTSDWHTAVISIIQAFGDQGPSTETHYANLQRRDKLNGAPWTNPTDPRNTYLKPMGGGKTARFCTVQSGPTSPDDVNYCYQTQEDTTAATWLAETTRARLMAGGINGVVWHQHHSLGVVLAGDFLTANDVVSVQTTLSAESTSGSAVDRAAAFMGAVASMNRLEGGIFEQASGPLDGGAATSLMVQANEHQIPFLDVTPQNAATVTSALTQPSNGWSSADAATINSYATANPSYELIVPLNASAGSTTINGTTMTFLDTGFAAFGASNDHVAYLATLGPVTVKGSGGATTDDPYTQAEQLVKVQDYAVKSRHVFNVNKASGDLELLPKPDLITGTGDFPYALSFQRVYDASSIGATIARRSGIPYIFPTEPEPSPIGGGWTHMLSIKAQIQSDAMGGLGRDSGLAASSAIAGMVVQRWLALGTVDIRSRLANIFVTHWLINGLNRNVVVLSQPPRRQLFAKLPDGSFDPGPGKAETLTQNGVQTFAGWNGAWVWNAIGMTFTLVAKDGSVMTLQQSLPSQGAPVTWTYPFTYIFVPTTWSFPTGVVISFTYGTTGPMAADNQACLTGVSNNLGRSLIFNDPCFGLQTAGNYAPPGVQSVQDDSGRVVAFSNGAGTPNLLSQYYLAGPLQVIGPDNGVTQYQYVAPVATAVNRPAVGVSQVFTPSDPANPYISVTYDALFRVSAISDNTKPSAYTTTYYIGGLFPTQNQKRAEVVDPDNVATTPPIRSVTTTSYFDRWNDTLQTIDPLGRVTSHAYDAHHRLARTTYPELNYDSFQYDVRSNLVTAIHTPKPGSSLAATTESVTYEEGPSVKQCLHRETCNQPASRQDANGNITSYAYLASGTGQLQRTTGPVIAPQSGGVAGSAQADLCYTSFTGSNGGAISLLSATIEKVDGTVNRVKSFAYNTLANHFELQTATADPATTYLPPSNAGGACTTAAATGALALATGFSFDAAGNVRSIDGPIPGSSDVTTYTFDSSRRLTTIASPLSALTRFCYDADGQLVSTNRARTATTDPNSATAATTGRCASAFPAATWLSETKAYFPTGDLASIADAEGHTTQYAYDPVGRRQVVQDADGRQIATIYDAAGEVIAEWRGGASWINSSTGQPVGLPAAGSWSPATYAGTGPILYRSYCNGTDCYTPDGKPKYAIDANNNRTAYQYDGLDRLQFTYFPDPSAGTSLCTPAPNDAGAPACAGSQTFEKLTYDSAGNRLSFRSRKGDLINYHFDSMNRPDIKTPASQGAVTTGFDLLGEPYQISKAAFGANPAHTTTYTYDKSGRKLTESNDGLAVTHGYDTLVSQSDNAGNLVKLAWPDGYYATYGYDALSRMVEVRENSATANELAYYIYDPLSRRQTLCLGAGSSGACQAGTWANTTSYSYEADGQLNGLSHNLNGVPVNFGYGRNNSSQITSTTVSNSFYLPTPAVTEVAASYVPNALNQYSSVDSQGLTYDLNGNLLTWVSATGQNTYTYDSENRLVTAAVSGATTPSITYDYDGLGRRVSKVVNGTATAYLLDGDEEIAEYSGATLLRRYVDGSDVDDRIAHVEGSAISSPSKTYYHVNHQGSVIDVTDAAGNASQSMSYDEYGNLSTGSSATGEQFRYTGRRYDPETGLYYYRARYYAPQLGRFLQTDPVGYKDDLNLYSYVRNDPLDRSDASGTESAFITTYSVCNLTGGSDCAQILKPYERAGEALQFVFPFAGALEAYDNGQYVTAAALGALDLASFGRGRIVSGAVERLAAHFPASLSVRTTNLLSAASNSIREHLTVADVRAAKRELAGEVVARKADGTPFNHVAEVRDGLNSLGNAIDGLKHELGNSSLKDESRKAVEQTLSALSRLKDEIESYLGWQ